ncbi:MAG: EAL domain-containing protein [Clostridia bacterium]|nr:EAL domain-containing protein [Clostridia bacterium]
MSNKDIVLVIDDDRIDREILKNILSKDFYVVDYQDAQEGFDFLARNEQDVKCVVVDVYMPGMDGYGFLKKVNESGLKIPVIVATSDSGEDTQVKVLADGAWDFISKPYNAEIVKLRVQNAIMRTEFFAFKKLKYIAEYDVLTGIFNKDKFLKKTRIMLDNNPDKKFAFIRFDIDRFQLVNSFYGSSEGDRIIKYLAMGLENLANQRQNLTYGRIEAEVFALCGEYETEEEVFKLIEDHIEIIKSYNRNFDLVPNFGVYFVDDLTLSPGVMLDRATLAAKECKGNYIDTVGVFKPEMSIRLEKEQEIVNEMVQALQEEQFIVYLQPKYSLETNAPAGAEALVRWMHPKKGMISPGLFIPVFEKNGFIERLDHYVWEVICKYLRKWLDEGIKPHPISVNISRVDLYNPQIVEFIIGLVDKYSIPHELFQLELTETAYMDNPHIMKQVVSGLKENGFTVMMDDFGSGYSSLSVLKEIEVDVLKIDMRFFDSTGTNDGRSENIIASVVRMAKWLGMPAVAEGVEKAEQVNFLGSVGCEYVQGFYFARPMPIDEYEKLVRENKEKTVTKNVDLTGALTMDKLWSSAPEMEILFSNSAQPSAICEFDGSKFTYLRTNNAYKELFGADGVSEGNPMDYIFYEYKNDVLEAFTNAIKNDEITECQYKRRVQQGNALWVSKKLQYIGKVGEEKSIFVANLTDITVQKEVETELKKLKKVMNSGNKDKPKKLLVVDDSELSSRIIKDIFDNSYEVMLAKNGLEGLNLLREYKNEVAVVLLDMVMPIMDGKEFLTHKNADEDTVDIPVIVISSENDEGLQVDMLQMGVNDYITKPFVAEVIARRVKNVIDYNERFRKMVKEYQNMSKD